MNENSSNICARSYLHLQVKLKDGGAYNGILHTTKNLPRVIAFCLRMAKKVPITDLFSLLPHPLHLPATVLS